MKAIMRILKTLEGGAVEAADSIDPRRTTFFVLGSYPVQKSHGMQTDLFIYPLVQKLLELAIGVSAHDFLNGPLMHAVFIEVE